VTVGTAALLAVGLLAPPSATRSDDPASPTTRAVSDRVLADEGPAASPAHEAPVPRAGRGNDRVSRSGTGELVVVPGSAAAAGEGPVRRYAVEVEEGLGIDPGSFARAVHATLSSPRSWGADGAMSFERTDGSEGSLSFRVTLASPEKTDSLCAPLRTNGQLSCFDGSRAVINIHRWLDGSQHNPDLRSYRDYVVNHEVGHALGHGHVSCPGAGELAPVMQQQTKGIAPCVPNPWPYPDAG
jgi:hypothetical protein